MVDKMNLVVPNPKGYQDQCAPYQSSFSDLYNKIVNPSNKRYCANWHSNTDEGYLNEGPDEAKQTDQIPLFNAFQDSNGGDSQSLANNPLKKINGGW
jgi:hypothetical protein